MHPRTAPVTSKAPPLRVATDAAADVLNALLHDEQIFLPADGELPNVGDVSDLVIESRHLPERLHVRVQIWGRRCAAGARNRLPAGVYVRLSVDEHAVARASALLRALCMISTSAMGADRTAELRGVFSSRASLHQALQRLAAGETASVAVDERVPHERSVRVTATCESGGGCTFVARTVSSEVVDGRHRCHVVIVLPEERARVARYVNARVPH